MYLFKQKLRQKRSSFVGRSMRGIWFLWTSLRAIRVGALTFVLSTPILLSACAENTDQIPTDNPARCIINLHFKLTDAKNGGQPLAALPWKITAGEKPESFELVKQDYLMALGETEEDGTLAFAEANEDTIRAWMCDGREKMWLAYPGHIEEIRLYLLPAHATPEHELFLILKSFGLLKGMEQFAPGVLSSKQAASDLKLATEQLEASDNAALLLKLRQELARRTTDPFSWNRQK